jgi:uncharacterized protein with PIN domain
MTGPDQSARTTDQDVKNQRRAVGIVRALTKQDETRCSDCGEMIDVSDADEEMEVVGELEAHREVCTGEWF